MLAKVSKATVLSSGIYTHTHSFSLFFSCFSGIRVAVGKTTESFLSPCFYQAAEFQQSPGERFHSCRIDALWVHNLGFYFFLRHLIWLLILRCLLIASVLREKRTCSFLELRGNVLQHWSQTVI